jgi:general L-amino acid transport system permease protein|tara:strand:+ start:496 stop:1650 length:1155 start_codon:yes stop_codon:yes gene_type:complete
MNFKNPKILIPQIITVVSLLSIIGYFAFNAQVNMGNRGISFGYGFLSQEASFDIGFSLIDYDGSMSYARAFLVGLLNTLLVSAIGIFFATLIGVSVGIGRLSENYLISKAAEIYVEIFRNVPLLLQLFFWYYAALRALPLPENAINIFDISYLTVKGWYVPKFLWTNFSVFLSSILASIIAIVFVAKYARKQREEIGKHVPTFFISFGILILFPLITFLVGGVTLKFEVPVLSQMSTTIFNFKGGVSIIPELISLAIALSMYTATFIAENVRAGILGVTKGQKEAAASIGLTKGQVLKLIVMPQALRIIIPPTTNQYLNLTKNSSLAAAIAYPDIVLVFAGTALMQTGRAVEIISITMGTYLFISLCISTFMNWYNKSVAIKEK